mgnify:CR=1 FL=1
MHTNELTIDPRSLLKAHRWLLTKDINDDEFAEFIDVAFAFFVFYFNLSENWFDNVIFDPLPRECHIFIWLLIVSP